MTAPGESGHLAWTCLFRHRGEETGARVAVRSSRGTLTYAELADAVSAGATILERRFGGARRVLVASRDQMRVALAFFAVLASGRVPMLADPTSVGRLREVVRRHAPGLLADEALLGELEGNALPAELCDGWIGAAGAPPELPPVGSRDEAFWVFTSGSTGEPKPVVHGHGAPVAAFEGFARGVLGLRAGDVTISTAGLPFVYALGNNLLFPLLAGASCILPDDLLLPTVLAALARHGATVLVAGPGSLEALGRLARRRDRAAALARLRLVLSAGEPLPARVFHEWEERFGRAPIDNLGCTETFNSFLSNAPGDAVAGTLGRPVPGFEVEVGGAAPRAGTRGPLRVRGASRALAVGEEDLVRGRWHEPSEWCETGDEVEVGADGRLRFLGRLDDRFKVKGRFVCPLEVERILLEVEGVRECLVVPGIGKHGLCEVVARVVADSAGEEAAVRRRLLQHARRRLEAFQVPARIEIVEALPRNARGKLERPRPTAPTGP